MKYFIAFSAAFILSVILTKAVMKLALKLKIVDQPNQERKIHPNAIRGALASIAIDFGMPILWTANQLETAELLFSIAKREQLDRKKSVSIRGKKKTRSMNEIQEYLVSGLPKISREKSKYLLKDFGTPQKIFMASEEELKDVEGVGEKLAKKIRKILTKSYEKSILED